MHLYLQSTRAHAVDANAAMATTTAVDGRQGGRGGPYSGEIRRVDRRRPSSGRNTTDDDNQRRQLMTAMMEDYDD